MKSALTKILVLVIFVALLAGCGGSSGGGGGGDDGDKSYNFRVSSHYPEGHSALDALNRVKDRIYADSDGRITLQIFPDRKSVV
jgi:TRAP-type C4-dicarboxylate transport system substrate-binding protein